MWDQASAEFYFAKSRELLTRPFPNPRPPHNSCRDLSHDNDQFIRTPSPTLLLEDRFQDLSIKIPNHPQGHMCTTDRSLTKSESMSRKTYSNVHKQKLERNHSFAHDPRVFPISYDASRTTRYYEPPFPVFDAAYGFEPTYSTLTYNSGICQGQSFDPFYNFPRQRTFSLSDNQDIVPKRSGRSIRDRNRRRQSYNPKAYEESSSSESECMSFGSADIDWRRRKRLSISNSSIRSDVGRRNRGNFLKPEQVSGKLFGKSPPPSSTVLSGLSPTSAARVARHLDSSSDSSL